MCDCAASLNSPAQHTLGVFSIASHGDEHKDATSARPLQYHDVSLCPQHRYANGWPICMCAYKSVTSDPKSSPVASSPIHDAMPCAMFSCDDLYMAKAF